LNRLHIGPLIVGLVIATSMASSRLFVPKLNEKTEEKEVSAHILVQFD